MLRGAKSLRLKEKYYTDHFITGMSCRAADSPRGDQKWEGATQKESVPGKHPYGLGCADKKYKHVWATAQTDHTFAFDAQRRAA